MTVKELIKELKHYPADSKVYIVKDWDTFDEDGILTDLTEVDEIGSQTVIIDEGLDFTDITEVLL